MIVKNPICLITSLFVMGAIDPTCTKEKVCQNGYTKTVRPTVSYTDSLKKDQLKSRGISLDNISMYEEDHFIPLELCGCPKCEENLWPEPWPEARIKDKEETTLHHQVCNGQLSIQDAQQNIRNHWKIY